VGPAGNVIEKERLIRCGRVEVAQMFDGLVGQIGGEVVAGVTDEGEDLGVIAEEVRRPLVGLAAHEAVEVFKAHP
jgi:hypothetical protein